MAERIIDISELPDFPNVERHLRIGPLNIDEEREVATQNFTITHRKKSDGSRIKAGFVDVQGCLTVTNEKFMNPQTGEMVEPNTPGAVPRFTFLMQYLLMQGVNFQTLSHQMILQCDARGDFNDYDNLMNL